MRSQEQIVSALSKVHERIPETTVVYRLPPQPDLPPGETFRCGECGTRLRSGQPHSALEPKPHFTIAALIGEPDFTETIH